MIERLRSAYRHGKAQASKRSRASGKTPQDGECETAAHAGHPEISTPAASGALVFANQHRTVRHTGRRTLDENRIGRRALIEHLEVKLRGDSFQSCREDIGFNQIGIFREPITTAAHLEHLQAQRFDPTHDVPDTGAGKAQRSAQTLAGMKLPVSQDAKQRKVGATHAGRSGEKNGQILASGNRSRRQRVSIEIFAHAAARFVKKVTKELSER